VPGGSTGLLTKNLELDVAAIRELRGNSTASCRRTRQRVERQKVEFADVTKAFDARNEEELEFFVKHSHWPEEDCACRCSDGMVHGRLESATNASRGYANT
jgi:hypothetical protein